MINMLNWLNQCASTLVSLSVPLTVLLGLLLLARGVVLQRFGARYQYALWLSVPLSCLMLLLPSIQPLSKGTPLYQLQVIAGQTSQQLVAETARWSVLPVIWLLGVLGLLLVLVYQYGGLAQLLRDSQPIDRQTCETMTANELTNRPELRLSSQLVGPFITGLWRPVVLLPADFTERYSTEQQRLIIRHELTHWQRGDLAANRLALGMLLLFWFNPLSWLAYRAYRQDQELACDALVLVTASSKQKVAYSYALLNHNTGNRHWALLSHAYGDKKMMKQRLVQLQRQQGMSKTAATLALVLLTVAFYGINSPAMSVDADATKAKEPVAIVRIEPKYPVDAARQRVEGYTKSELKIDGTGAVVAIKILESYPAGVFDEVSIRAFEKWRFTPSNDGISTTQVQLDFKMDEEPADEAVNNKHSVVPHSS